MALFSWLHKVRAMGLKILKCGIICVLSSVFCAAQSVRETDSLKLVFNSIANDSNKVKTAFQISKRYWYSNPDSAEVYAQKGLQLARSIHFRKGEADCLNSLSAVFWMQRNYPAALDYTLQNLDIRHEIGDKIGIFNASNNLGLIYYETKKYDFALRYSKEASSIANELKDSKKIAKASVNLGLIYYQLKDTASAYSNYKKALKYFLVLKDTMELSYLYFNLGELFQENKPATAILYFQKALVLAEKQDNKELIPACLQVLADEKRKTGNPDEAIVLGKRALAIATEIKNLKVMDLSAQTLYRAYREKRDFGKSLEYYIIANNAQDSMLNEKKIAEMSDLKYNFELKQKQKQIELLERDKIITQKNAQNQRLIFYLEIFALIIAGLVLFGLYRNFRLRREKAERASYEKMLIEAKEKAEENDRLKTAFLCNMSHEIRTPMNAIIGFTDLLVRQDVSTEKQKRYSMLIKDRTVDLLHIIEDILDVSKMEVGQIHLHEENTDLEALMKELLDYYRLKITNSSKSDLQISYSMDGFISGKSIIVDAQRLKQILGNLLDNAFKFTEKGFIEYGCKPGEKENLLFYVMDSGIGISRDKHKIIFDRFRQADDQYTVRQFGGTGLGLSIVKGLLELMGGTIWVESTPGEGSVFYFTLPLKIAGSESAGH